MEKKKATNENASSPKTHPHGNSTSGQHQRIEQALRDNPEGLTTIELVEQYDILRPGARICEMRWDLGLNIKSVRSHDITSQGNKHQIVRYVLMPGEWKGAAA